MADIGYELKLKQSLKLAPQFIQMIGLLQMNQAQLAEHVKSEVEANPLLEEVKKDKEFNDYGSSGISATDVIEGVSEYEETLSGHLMPQIEKLNLDLESLRVIEYIIGNVNDKARLEISLSDVSSDLILDLELVKNAHQTLLSLDPVGSCATSLKECLVSQIKIDPHSPKNALNLVENHLDNLEKGKVDIVLNDLDIDFEEFEDLTDYLSSLDPFPGANYSTSNTQFVVPDIYVFNDGQDFRVSVSKEIIPEIKINENALSYLDDSEESRKFLANCRSRANSLLRAIEKRESGIYLVTNSIVSHQQEYFSKGKKYIKPITMKQIALECGVHESTVSRVCSNKYVETPKGIIQLSMFFSPKFITTSGEMITSIAIRSKVQELIMEEDKDSPLSDQTICDLLQKEGIPIARRTIAKYRKILKIPPSSKRRKK